LRRIAAGALFLSERFTQNRRVPGGPAPESVTRLLELWKRHASGGNADRFARRLSWDGLTEEDAVATIWSDPEPGTALPAWTFILRDFLLLAPDFDLASAPFIDPSEPLPFQDILAPLVAAASRQVGENPGIGGPAMQRMERSLLASVCGIAGETLLHEFAGFRSSRQTFVRAGATTGLPNRI
jgi:hypothetical protein